MIPRRLISFASVIAASLSLALSGGAAIQPPSEPDTRGVGRQDQQPAPPEKNQQPSDDPERPAQNPAPRKKVVPSIASPAQRRDGKIVRPFDRLLIDHERLLAAIVDENGLIRYDLIIQGAEHHDLLKRLVRSYANIPTPSDSRPDAELAFLINAFNINVIDLIVQNHLPERVTDVPGFFDQTTLEIGRRKLTLDRLVDDFLRPLDDPRIHAALNRGAMSSPPMAAEPYRPESLNEQLDRQAQRWINDPRFSAVSEGAGAVIRVSRVFERYASDFDDEPYGGVRGFMLRFADKGSPLAIALGEGGALRGEGEERSAPPALEYLEDDWSLNRAPVNGPEPKDQNDAPAPIQR